MKRPYHLIAFEGFFYASFIALIVITYQPDSKVAPITVMGQSIVMLILVLCTAYGQSRIARVLIMLSFFATLFSTLPMVVMQYHGQHHLNLYVIPLALQTLGILCLMQKDARMCFKKS